MPVVLRLKRYIVLPSDWSSWEDWSRQGFLDGFLRTMSDPEDVRELIEAMGGLAGIVDAGFYSRRETKVCIACGAEKPLGEFHWNGNRGSRRPCRECYNASEKARKAAAVQLAGVR